MCYNYVRFLCLVVCSVICLKDGFGCSLSSFCSCGVLGVLWDLLGSCCTRIGSAGQGRSEQGHTVPRPIVLYNKTLYYI